jgi:hypothetical protein
LFFKQQKCIVLVGLWCLTPLPTYWSLCLTEAISFTDPQFIGSMGLSWSWLYGSWIYNYLWNQCLSPLKLWVWTPFIVYSFGSRNIWYLSKKKKNCFISNILFFKQQKCIVVVGLWCLMPLPTIFQLYRGSQLNYR